MKGAPAASAKGVSRSESRAKKGRKTTLSVKKETQSKKKTHGQESTTRTGGWAIKLVCDN